MLFSIRPYLIVAYSRSHHVLRYYAVNVHGTRKPKCPTAHAVPLPRAQFVQSLQGLPRLKREEKKSTKNSNNESDVYTDQLERRARCSCLTQAPVYRFNFHTYTPVFTNYITCDYYEYSISYYRLKTNLIMYEYYECSTSLKADHITYKYYE